MVVIILLLFGVVIIAATRVLEQKIDAEIQYEREQQEATKAREALEREALRVAAEKRERAKLERNTQITAHKAKILHQKTQILAIEHNIESAIQRYYSSTQSNAEVNRLIDNHFSSVQNALAELKESVRQLELLTKSYNEETRTFILEAEETILPNARQLAEKFRNYDSKVCSLPKSVMMESGNYSKQNKAFSESILTMTREDSTRFIQHCETVLLEGQLDKIFEIDIEKVLRHVWFFATEKNYSASDFERATAVFSRIYKAKHTDVVLAGYYAKKQMGGEDALRDPVRELLKQGHSREFLTTIASGRMWMNAYQQEHVVLQHMLASGMEMIPKAQERLRALASSGGKAPESFSVESSDDSLYFDVSSLAWRDAEYTGFFDNLAFQDKALTYSLAIRDEDKELFVAPGITVPNIDTLLAKLNETLAEEFGPAVTAKSVHCLALSGNSEEPMDGILVSTTECKHMGVFLHIARIGKKLIIKFYTLFIPIGTDLTVQRQQSMSMSKKLSPTVTMWESSLKDTMLVAVQQLLNSDVPAGLASPANPASEPVYF